MKISHQKVGKDQKKKTNSEAQEKKKRISGGWYRTSNRFAEGVKPSTPGAPGGALRNSKKPRKKEKK